jgi:hypothetical protein
VFALDYPTTMCLAESSILDKYLKGLLDHIVGYIIAMPAYTVCICCKICFHGNRLSIGASFDFEIHQMDAKCTLNAECVHWPAQWLQS